MRNYREQLYVPVSYWLLGLVSVAIIATTLWAGFSVGLPSLPMPSSSAAGPLFLFELGQPQDPRCRMVAAGR